MRPGVGQKRAAIVAHRSEAGREQSLPGFLSRVVIEPRGRIIATENFTRISVTPSAPTLPELTA
ncbi:hypothetical protein [Streptomyces syringium]|uniref:hypothetical protein n=1 Tax=Streptomyces syringium TaxID=76729 RepID=UPI0033D79335